MLRQECNAKAQVDIGQTEIICIDAIVNSNGNKTRKTWNVKLEMCNT